MNDTQLAILINVILKQIIENAEFSMGPCNDINDPRYETLGVLIDTLKYISGECIVDDFRAALKETGQ
jgi:hypothetical protein